MAIQTAISTKIVLAYANPENIVYSLKTVVKITNKEIKFNFAVIYNVSSTFASIEMSY